MLRYSLPLSVLSLPILFAQLPSVAAKSPLEEGGWESIPAAELEATEPLVDPDAPVEFTYRSLFVNDLDLSYTHFNFHNRAKIFTEAGVKEWQKIDLEYQTGWSISHIKGRVIYPDGSVSLLDKKDIFKRKVFKDGKFEGFAKSFSFPGLKPGCIVEYKWKKRRAFWSLVLNIPLLAEWPTWQYDIAVKPFRGLASMTSVHNSLSRWEKKKGRTSLTAKFLAARSEQPFLVPRRDFEPWVFVEYGRDLDHLEGEDYWGYRGNDLVDLNKDFVRSKQKSVKQLAERLFEGLETEEERLRAAYAYCAEDIVNISAYTDRYTEEEIEDLKKNESPSETIKRGYGRRYDINAVFASLCGAVGLNARMVSVEDRSDISYREGAQGAYVLSDWVVAIDTGSEYRFFDPGSSFLPFEVLNSRNTGSHAIMTEKQKKKWYYRWIKTPAAESSDSRVQRIAKVEIDEFGDLKARIVITYQGYPAIQRKRLFASLTDSEREDYILSEEWQSRLPRAKVENVRFRNLSNRKEPLRVDYDIEIPGYADSLGERMLFNPSLFEEGRKPLFVSEKRREPIAFDYLFTVQDQVSFRLPEGFEAEDDHDYSSKIDNTILTRASKVTEGKELGSLVYQRLISFNSQYLNAKYYDKIKEFFEAINSVDSQPLSVVRREELAKVSDLD